MRQVTRAGGASFAPFMHPNDQQIIFSSNFDDPTGRAFALYLVNLDGSGLERVTWAESLRVVPDVLARRPPAGLLQHAQRHRAARSTSSSPTGSAEAAAHARLLENRHPPPPAAQAAAVSPSASRGLHVDDELELGWLLDRELAGLSRPSGSCPRRRPRGGSVRSGSVHSSGVPPPPRIPEYWDAAGSRCAIARSTIRLAKGEQQGVLPHDEPARAPGDRALERRGAGHPGCVSGSGWSWIPSCGLARSASLKKRVAVALEGSHM